MGNALATSNDAQYQDKRAELGYARDVAALSAADRAALLALYTTTYTYDERQNLVELRSPGGDLTRYEYDSYGNLTRRIVHSMPATSHAAKQQVTQYFYDAYGQHVEHARRRGPQHPHSYDHFGNLLTSAPTPAAASASTPTTRQPAAHRHRPRRPHHRLHLRRGGQPRSRVRDAGGHSVLYVYDRNNLLLDHASTPRTATRAATASPPTRYDVVGNRTQVTDAEGRVHHLRLGARTAGCSKCDTPSVANAAGSAQTSYIKRYDYDGVGNRIAVHRLQRQPQRLRLHESGAAQAPHRRARQRHRIPLRRQPEPDPDRHRRAAGAPSAGACCASAFDEEDQRIAEIDALGGATRYMRDAVGNVIATTDATATRPSTASTATTAW